MRLWVTSVGKSYWKEDDILDIWVLHFPWLSLWLVWSSVVTGHPNNSTMCRWLRLRQKLNLVYRFGITCCLLCSPSVDTGHLLPATLKCWLSTASRGHCSLPESGWVPGHLAGQAPPGMTPLESYSHTCLATSFLFHFLLSIHVLLDDMILVRNVLWWKYRAKVPKNLDSTSESLDWAFDEVKKYTQSTMGRLLLHKINLAYTNFNK